MKALRSFFVDLGAVALIVGIIGVVVWEARRQVVLIEPITAPKRLSEAGYTPDVIASQLKSHILYLRESVLLSAGKRRGARAEETVKLARERPNVDLPGTGLSIRTLVVYLQDIVGDRSTKVTGELTELGGTLQFHLRINGKRIDVPGKPPAGLDDLLTQAALAVVWEEPIKRYSQAIERDPKAASAFYIRGIAYNEKKDYDRAIKDYNQAIRLNPNYAFAYNNRGDAYNEKRRYDRALADYEAAARIDREAAWHDSMGWVFFYLGRFAQSAEAMEKAVQSWSQDMYAILWRYLAQAKSRSPQTALRELSENAAKLKEQDDWPAPVIDFYLGKIDEKELYAAVEDADAKKKSEQVCEANFYAAEAKLLRGLTKEAIPLLRAAQKDCPSDFPEAHGASAELKRLGQR